MDSFLASSVVGCGFEHRSSPKPKTITFECVASPLSITE